MARRNRAPRTPNHTPQPTTEAAPTNPTLRDLETLTLGEYLKGKLSYAMGQRAVARAEKAVDSRLDFIDEQLANGGTIPMHMATMNRSDRDELVNKYVQDKKNEREYKKEKRKYVLRRIGSAAMWIPGVDIIGSRIQESVVARKIDKKIRRSYQASNGGSGFLAPFTRIRNSEANRLAKDKAALREKKQQILFSRQEWGDF